RSPDGPDRDGRASAAARALQPSGALPPGRAGPPALEGAEALRVERLHLPDRGPAADSRADARALGALQVAAMGEGVHAGAGGAAEVRAARARAPWPAPLARAGARCRPLGRAARLVGDAGAADVDAGALAPARPSRRGRPPRRAAAVGSRRA